MPATEPLVFDAIRTPRGKGQGERVAAHHQAGRSGRRADARDAQPQPRSRPAAGRRRGARLRVADRRPGRRHRQDRGDQGRPAGHRLRRAAQPLLRVGAGGGQHRRAEGRLGLGGPRAGGRRRVDVAGADGLRRRRLGDGSRDQLRDVVHPAGDQRRPDRHDRGVQPRRRRRLRRALAGAGRDGAGARAGSRSR